MAAIAVTTVAAAVAVAEGRDDHARHGMARAGAAVADLASSYAFLTASSSIPLPRGLRRNVSALPGGTLDLPRGREAGSVGAERLWLVPGRARSCLVLDDGGGACGPTSLIARQGVLVMLVPVSGAAPTVYGIVPDGATVSGRAVKVTRSGNAYVARPTSRHLGNVVVRTQRGVRFAFTIPPATGHPQ